MGPTFNIQRTISKALRYKMLAFTADIIDASNLCTKITAIIVQYFGISKQTNANVPEILKKYAMRNPLFCELVIRLYFKLT